MTVCKLFGLVLATSLFGWTQEMNKQGDIEAVSSERAVALDNAFEALVMDHKINTLGVAVIKDGVLHWKNYYGTQSPGIPASEKTLFNVASVTKTVAAETILRLVSDGKLSLDEPISPYWIDSDLKEDPQHSKLTARMLLSHTSGFPNWRFMTRDYKLQFLNPPGERYGYSGEGFQYLMRFAQNKLDTPFDVLAQSYVFDPIGMSDVAIKVIKANDDRIARPLDEAGKFYGNYCRPQGYCREEGSLSAAGDMVISVADYAKFLISAMNGEGLSDAVRKERGTTHVTSYEIDCSQDPDILCPRRLGYGLGWNITELENTKLIGHSGSDWSMVSLAYYYESTRDGLILFFNAPNKRGIAGMVDALELLDPDSPKLHEYRARRARAN